jgi:hypothetical protein
VQTLAAPAQLHNLPQYVLGAASREVGMRSARFAQEPKRAVWAWPVVGAIAKNIRLVCHNGLLLLESYFPNY